MRYGALNTTFPLNRASPLAKGLVSMWLPITNRIGGGTLYDIVGQNNGTLTNGPTWRGNLLSFDGIDDYVSIPYAPTAYPVSYVAWFRTSNGSATFRCIFSSANSGDTANQIALSITDAQNIRWNARYNGTDTFIDSATAVNDGVWHCAAGVSRAANDHELFVDGISRNTSTTNIGGFPILNRSSIGSLNRSSNIQFYAGLVRSTGIYNRALSATEFMAVYQDGLAGYRSILNYTQFPQYSPPAPVASSGCMQLLNILGA